MYSHIANTVNTAISRSGGKGSRFARTCLTTLLVLLAVSAFAITDKAANNDLAQSSVHGKVVSVTLDVISRYHYRKRHIDDNLSSQVLDKYLEDLDSNRMFFISADIDRFIEMYNDSLDDSLVATDLEPAFTIFRVYRQRVLTRIVHAKKILQQDFDFSVDENYTYDRGTEPWASDILELNRIWTKRVKHEALNLHIAGQSTDDIRNALDKRYQAIANNVTRFNSDDVFQAFMNSFTSVVEPHTSYLSPKLSENFDINMRLSLEGIGAVLSNEGTEYTIVQRLVPGGPADLGGELKSGDRITGVAQGDISPMQDVIGLRLNDVVQLIRGPQGTVVRLQVLGEGLSQHGVTRTIRIVRDKVKLEQRAARSFTIDVDGLLFGVIDIPSFYSDFAAQNRGDRNYRSTARDVRELLGGLNRQGIEGLIIDLRGNGGGSLREALELIGLFIRDGPILQTRTSDGTIDISYDRNPAIAFSKDLVVLVDRNSASASEIFAGAMQDYRRGIIVGETTFGKGTVQNVINLNEYAGGAGNNLGRLKTTIAQFYRITGNSNQYLGISPDLKLPSPGDTGDYGERAYSNALPWDTISPANYIPLNRGVSIEFLREQHARRMKEVDELSNLAQRIEILQQRRNEKSVSLLESTRRKEHTELLALQEQDESNSETAPDKGQDYPSGELRELGDLDIILRETGRIIRDMIEYRHQRKTAASNRN